VRIFISHQQADIATARELEASLKGLGHSCYLDVIDPHLNQTGDDLAEHIRNELGSCDCLLAVVSVSTYRSAWVPWEIGVATEKNYPLGTYLTDTSEPLEFMKKWPVLRSLSHLREFARSLNLITANARVYRDIHRIEASKAQNSAVRDFHESVKKAIGQ